MSENNEILYELLEEVLGEPKKIYESKGQVSYNCPICDEDRNKGNLEINIFQHVYKCWSCGDINETHGSLKKFFDKLIFYSKLLVF